MTDRRDSIPGARGVIYLVATPIGNLEDITLRALRVLRQADIVACEDTRHTGRLLHHHGIDNRLVSFHEHNEPARAKELVARALNGEAVALVSDAGTPTISDPGYRLVQAALQAGVRIVPVPGANAAVSALTASGLPTHRFTFLGFLPSKQGQRRKAIRSLANTDGTVILYESPHRILATLEDLARSLGDRRIALARELTKIHEEYLRGSAASIRDQLSQRGAVRGEFVLLIGPGSGPPQDGDSGLAGRVRELQSEGHTRMESIKRAAKERRLSKREAYALLLAE